MSGPVDPRRPVPRRRPASLLARAALALYPPSWRARYQDEVLMLLEDSGGRLREVASVAWRALPAWICPSRHLHDRPGRARASLSTALICGSMLTGLGLVFAQLTQFQGRAVPGHPEIGWAYAVFDIALAVSALAAGLGGLPLWLVMLRRARREHRARDLAYLLLPVVAPVTYLASLVMTIPLIRGPQGVSTGWFGVITLAGFAAAAISAAGPGAALRRLRPRGPALRLAATAAGLAAAGMAVAAMAVVVAVTALGLRASHLTGSFSPILAAYLALVVTTATATAVSAARGARAVRAES